jgi:hypothetical protein
MALMAAADARLRLHMKERLGHQGRDAADGVS